MFLRASYEHVIETIINILIYFVEIKDIEVFRTNINWSLYTTMQNVQEK